MSSAFSGVTGESLAHSDTGDIAVVQRRLHAAVGAGGQAHLRLHTGHDGRPFVYLAALVDDAGAPHAQSPQQLLGFEGWLRTVEQLTRLLEAQLLPGEGRFRELPF
jgi:hypothetical protein